MYSIDVCRRSHPLKTILQKLTWRLFEHAIQLPLFGLVLAFFTFPPLLLCAVSDPVAGGTMIHDVRGGEESSASRNRILLNQRARGF